MGSDTLTTVKGVAYVCLVMARYVLFVWDGLIVRTARLVCTILIKEFTLPKHLLLTVIIFRILRILFEVYCPTIAEDSLRRGHKKAIALFGL